MGIQPCKSEGAIRTVDGRAHHADAIRRGNAPPLHTRAVGVGGEYASHANRAFKVPSMHKVARVKIEAYSRIPCLG